ncbi:MAG: sel1 repeat family protein [Magnetococcales bacterium]|nr:sel1 repeat family protein [Magnetococcales bacterium]
MMVRFPVLLLCCLPLFAWADAVQDKADAGDAEAQYQVAVRYAEGEGVGKNPEEAAKWFQKSADNGDVDAMVMMGILFENGQGVKKDLSQAAQWYEKAAQRGHSEGQYYIAMMYAYGQGVKKDLLQAGKWLEVGAANKDERAVRARDAVQKLMTPQQIVEARKWAKEFKPGK